MNYVFIIKNVLRRGREWLKIYIQDTVFISGSEAGGLSINTSWVPSPEVCATAWLWVWLLRPPVAERWRAAGGRWLRAWETQPPSPRVSVLLAPGPEAARCLPSHPTGKEQMVSCWPGLVSFPFSSLALYRAALRNEVYVTPRNSLRGTTGHRLPPSRWPTLGPLNPETRGLRSSWAEGLGNKN